MIKDINFWISIFSIIIPVFATIYTVNDSIKNRNRENHQPYLILNKINKVSNPDVYKYHLTLKSKHYDEKVKKTNTLYIDLMIKNIGYGVATNIKFYDLLTGNQLDGNIEKNMEQNQKLFTTFDMASSEEKNVQTILLSVLKDDDDIIVEDYARVLCVYKDLHNNTFTFIICINIKSNEHYDFYAYQPSSLSYKRYIKENRNQYDKIIKRYKRL